MKIGVRCAIIIFAVFALILPARLHARIVTRAPTCCGASCRVAEPAVSGSRQPFGSSTFPHESAVSTTTLYGGDPPVEVRYDPLPPRRRVRARLCVIPRRGVLGEARKLTRDSLAHLAGTARCVLYTRLHSHARGRSAQALTAARR